ncbi:MAG: DNA gyrase inhibitor YacG [Hyphomicrobiales bacterium]
MRPVDKSAGGGGRRDGGEKCPICGKPRDEKYRPFCSKRCADVDLSRWLSGAYAIPGDTPAGRPGEADTED